MRNPRNEPLVDPDGPTADGPERDGPERTCILSREHGPRERLIRLALGPEGQILPDVRAKAPGRGAWIGVPRGELLKAMAKGRLRGALARAFKTSDLHIPEDLDTRIADALQRAALDRLGLESRAGKILIGHERIEAAARGGKVALLLHASDAATDGRRKLDQAWRVGRDREGSGEQGLALPVPRTILGLALGRENVVHAAVTDFPAAGRVRDALTRWQFFIGPDPDSVPCETASQGAAASETGPEAGWAPSTADDLMHEDTE